MARSSFKFRMQRLLDVRIMREKLAQSELLEKQRALQAEQDRLTAMQAEEQRLRTAQAQPLQRGEDLHEFVVRREFLEKAIKESEQQQVGQQGVIAKAERAVLDQQDVVKQRGIEVKALEKIKDKQREEHRLDQLREEGLFMDDLAGQGFLRRKTIAERVSAEDEARRIAESEGAPQ